MYTKNNSFCDFYYGTHSNPCYTCPKFDACQNETQKEKLKKGRKSMGEAYSHAESEEE